MKLNRLERYTAYIFMLEYMVKAKLWKTASLWSDVTYPAGFCYVIYDVFGIASKYGDSIKYNLSHFPELNTKLRNWGPAGTDSGWNDRIAALRQCIEETHPDNPKNKRK